MNHNANFASQSNTQSIGYKQLVETIAALSTDLVEMTDRADGLDPAEEHTISVAEYAAELIKLGKEVTQRDRIRLGQVGGAQGTLAGRPPVVVERIVSAKFGLRKKVMVKLHARTSLDRGAHVIGLI